jgi:hypothetical protein
LNPLPPNRFSRSVSNVQQRDPDILLYDFIQFMHGICTNIRKIRTTALKAARRINQNFGGLIPAILMLQRFKQYVSIFLAGH